MSKDKTDDTPELPEFIPLGKVAARLPTRENDGPITAWAVRRWAVVGLRGIKLRTTMVGGCRCTTKRWLLAFFDRLAAQADAFAGPPTDRQRRALERAREDRAALAGTPPKPKPRRRKQPAGP
jgi:hypothetical protein